MEYLNVEKELERFAKEVKKESKANLKRLDKKASGDLINKMGYDLNSSKNSFELGIGWPENQGAKYAPLINYGVKGVSSGKSLKGFKYTNKKPPMRELRPHSLRLQGPHKGRTRGSNALQNTKRRWPPPPAGGEY